MWAARSWLRVDRCPQSSTRLSGPGDSGGRPGIRSACRTHCCRLLDTAGECSGSRHADGPLPPSGRCLATFEVGGRLRPSSGYGIDMASARRRVPANSGVDRRRCAVLAGEPYPWPTSALRRSKLRRSRAFAWCTTAGLCRPGGDSAPCLDPSCGRVTANCIYPLHPPESTEALCAVRAFALNRMLPNALPVDLEFPCGVGVHRPAADCGMRRPPPTRNLVAAFFWFVSASDDLDGDARPILPSTDILDEDSAGRVPPNPRVGRTRVLAFGTHRSGVDRYRRWLRDLFDASGPGPARVRRVLRESSSSLSSHPPR